MSYFDRKSVNTRNIMSNDDIEGSKPSSYINKFERRDPLKVNDIQGAVPSTIVGYTGADRYNVRRNPKDFIYGPTKRQLKDQWFSPVKVSNKATVFNSSSYNNEMARSQIVRTNNSVDMGRYANSASVGHLGASMKPNALNTTYNSSQVNASVNFVGNPNRSRPLYDTYGQNIQKPQQVSFKPNFASNADRILGDCHNKFTKSAIASSQNNNNKSTLHSQYSGSIPVHDKNTSKYDGMKSGYQNLDFIFDSKSDDKKSSEKYPMLNNPKFHKESPHKLSYYHNT